MSDFDLTGPRAVLERRLVDSCRITHDPEQETDDVLDPDTLLLVAPNPDGDLVYEGACMISTLLAEQIVVVGAREVTRRRYRARLPHDAPAPAVGDTLTITDAHYDPALVDVSMIITDVPLRTHNISRQVVLQHDLGERG